MAASGDGKGSSKASKALSQEQILAGFNKLIKDQKMIFTKIAEFENEKKEHE